MSLFCSLLILGGSIIERLTNNAVEARFPKRNVRVSKSDSTQFSLEVKLIKELIER